MTLAALLVVGMFPIVEVIRRPLKTEFLLHPAPAQGDGIVVLGGVEDQRTISKWREPQLNEAAERLTVAATIAIAHPEARVVFSGGNGRMMA